MKERLTAISTVLLILAIIACLFTIRRPVNEEKLKKEIFGTEKAFEKMTSEKSVAEAFYFFADENAVIKRGNDSLIYGNENIRHYYLSRNLKNAQVTWTPDFISTSKDGTLGYTYGKFTWKVIRETGDTVVAKGVFHTVWKKQKDGSWKYVWD
jgi:ketosteroid isomerase-like protein